MCPASGHRIETTVDGYIVMPPVHDSWLAGITVLRRANPREESLRLDFVSEGEVGRFSVIFPGLQHLRVENYAENNVVFDVLLAPLPTIPIDEIAATCSVAPDELSTLRLEGISKSLYLHLTMTHMSSYEQSIRAILATRLHEIFFER